ncbi:hypothetical protein GCM10009096_33740 [Parasphingorhabdus litoris]|uniref:Lipoprotein n=1 Tax=Parasphingorhabdus litoris TaxID=394733 RepID=A0ABN1B1R5_9SPHN|nr:hypothetical protein [Parasphingorhabdus litoris]
MTYKYLAAVATIPLVLSACSAGESKDGEGFEMSIDVDGEEGKQASKINIGGEGEDSKFSIKTDGFSMDVDLPQISLDSDDFDLNNVSLYPGTKVTGLDVEDKDGEGGKVVLSFDAPSSTEELVSWFEKKMTDENFVVEKDGTTLSGKTDEGDPFVLKLTEKTADETSGELEFSENK